jgi:hypothetical protein
MLGLVGQHVGPVGVDHDVLRCRKKASSTAHWAKSSGCALGDRPDMT